MKTILVTLGILLSMAVPCFAQMKAIPVEIKNDKEQGVFVARYPRMEGETSREKAAALRINTTIKSVMEKMYKDVWDNWHQSVYETGASYISKDIDYNITYQDEAILSINFTDTFAQGDSGSLFIKDGMTFSKATGRLLSWKDVMKPEDRKIMNKDHLSSLLSAGANRGDYILYVGFTGLETMPGNYYVDNTGTLHFQLNPGSVGPFTSGVIDVDTGCVTADNIEGK